MGCNCKSSGNNENTTLTNENVSLGFKIKDYIIRIILFIILVPFMIPITIGVFFYVIVVNKSNLDGFKLMTIIVKVLKTALREDIIEEDDEEDEDVELNEDNYELDETIN